MATLHEKHSDMVSKLVKDPSDIIASVGRSEVNLIHMVLGVAGEAGELVDAIKKYAIYGKPIDVNNVIEELGDLEFYMEGIRQELGITREEPLYHNLSKLAMRYKNYDYTDQRAIDRADKAVPPTGTSHTL